jgi:hypothetical protein
LWPFGNKRFKKDLIVEAEDILKVINDSTMPKVPTMQKSKRI